MKTTQALTGTYWGQASRQEEVQILTGARDRAPRNLETYQGATGRMPRMVLDSELHWDWRNPLNLIPALLALLTVYGVVGTFL